MGSTQECRWCVAGKSRNPPLPAAGRRHPFCCVDVEEAVKDTMVSLGVERYEVVGLRPVGSESSVLEHLIRERRPTAAVAERFPGCRRAVMSRMWRSRTGTAEDNREHRACTRCTREKSRHIDLPRRRRRFLVSNKTSLENQPENGLSTGGHSAPNERGGLVSYRLGNTRLTSTPCGSVPLVM
jgi:hypothetical protein